jgi:hypothetical protein
MRSFQIGIAVRAGGAGDVTDNLTGISRKIQISAIFWT